MAERSQVVSEGLLEIPAEFLCALTMEVMKDPVICTDGYTYERIAIEAWFRNGHRTSPRTNAHLANLTLTPNIALRQAIETYTRIMPEIQLRYIQKQQESINFQEIIRLRELEITEKQICVETEREQLIRERDAALRELEALRLAGVRQKTIAPQQSNMTTQYQAQAAQAVKLGVHKATPQITAAQLQAFLNHVAAGQQDEAEALLKQTPILTLGAGNVTDHANRTFHDITGFQYAVWALDWYMWRMIKKYLPPEEAHLQAEGFATGSWVKEHGEHVTWKRLIDNYQTYRNNMSWGYERAKKYWVQEIGGAQLMLPMHVLQEYCQPSRSFDPTPNFKADIVLVRKLPARVKLEKVGYEFAIVWMYVGSSYSHDGSLPGIFSIHNDEKALVYLYDTRTQQRQELVVELRPSLKFQGFAKMYPPID